MTHAHHVPALAHGAGNLEDARTWLADADRILLTAGAGLSAAAGFDYADHARFTELFPALTELGFGARYELIGAALPATHLWGFWAVHTMDIRFDPRPNPLYAQVRDLVADTDHFVLTSNVDALFTRNGFDHDRVFTPQGDYGLYQCMTPCTRQVWDSLPAIERVLADYDPTTGSTTLDAVPMCPTCGGQTYLNVNAGRNYVADHFWPIGDRLNTWLNSDRDASTVVLEIGAGFNTPSVVRWPGESITRAMPNGHLIRINAAAPGVPADIAPRSSSIGLDVRDVIQQLGRANPASRHARSSRPDGA